MYQNQIKKYRKQKGLTLAQLAEKVDSSIGYICHLENGTRRNPSTELMVKISKALDENILEVFFHEEWY